MARSINLSEAGSGTMEENFDRAPVERRTPITESAEVLSALCEIWEKWKFEERLSFWETFFESMWNDDSTDGENRLEEIRKYEEMTEWEGEPLVPGFRPAVISIAIMNASCAFSVQAMKAEKNSASAWAYCCEANHWLGMLQGYISGRAIGDRSTFARKGAIVKNQPMANLQQWVLERYREGTFASPHEASHKLAPDAIKKAPEFNTRLSTQRAQKTIYDWLRTKNIEI